MSKKPIKSTAQIDKELSPNIDNGGLRLSWKKFADEYVANGGNGTKAYQKAFPDVTDDNVAAACASRLLRNANVSAEIENILSKQKVTDEYIYNGFVQLYEDNKVGKGAMVGCMALERLAKMKGLMVDTKRHLFNDENPAYVPPVVSKERAAELDKDMKGGGLIE